MKNTDRAIAMGDRVTMGDRVIRWAIGLGLVSCRSHKKDIGHLTCDGV